MSGYLSAGRQSGSAHSAPFCVARNALPSNKRLTTYRRILAERIGLGALRVDLGFGFFTPMVEVDARGLGIRVVGAEDPFAYWQEFCVQVVGGCRIPRHPSPSG